MMAGGKRILIVDDDFEIALFLRTALEMLRPDYQAVSVPSAEEGMLEIRRASFDLVIADIKLPGIDGLEFIDRVRLADHDVPIIGITGEPSDELRRKIPSLGLDGFLFKPLDVDELTGLVSRILAGEPAARVDELTSAVSRIPEAEQAARAGAAAVSRPSIRHVTHLLSALRIDTGARYAMLVNLDGHRLVADGQVSDLDTEGVASLLAKELPGSFELGEALKASSPQTVLYQAGAVHHLYAANVGTSHLVALIYDAERGQSQIGAVWVYTRRAIPGLLEALGGTAPVPAPPPEPTAELVEFPEELDVSPPDQAEVALSPEEVDAFWDSSLNQEAVDQSAGFSGINLDEARRQGLIPSDFDLPPWL